MKRFIAVFMMLLMLIPTFASCEKPQQSNDTQPATTAEPIETEAPTEGDTEPDVTTTDASATTTEPDGGKEEPVSTKSPQKIIEEIAPNEKFIMATTGCREVVLKAASKDTVLDVFKAEDFSILETTPIDGAKFETIVLRRNFDLVTMYWSETEKELRVMWEKANDNAVAPLSPNEETGKGSISITQIGIERDGQTDNPQIGMCYIIKLSNGNAIVIDGGFSTVVCADNIYNTLEKMGISKVGGKYVIEAWIFTHGHADHCGIFVRLFNKYKSKIDVKHVVSGFPGSDTVVNGYQDQLSTAAFAGTRRINPHAGIKYYFGNVTVSMLYTPDMIYVSGKPVNYYNDTSLAFKIEGGGSSAFFFGDAVEAAATEMLLSYETSAFKSDIVQITHHGLYTTNGGHTWTNLKKLYTAIDSTYAFLPMHSRYGTSGRNGRYTVLCQWGGAGYQIAFVTNEKDNHGISSISQQYFDDFEKAAMAGTNEKETLLGYNGINKIVSEDGLITYLGSNATTPMVTTFEFADGNVTLKTNEELYSWLGLAE